MPDFPDWQRPVAIASGVGVPLLASGKLNFAGNGSEQIPLPSLTGYEQVRLVLSQILANGGNATLQLLIQDDALGGNYNFRVLDLAAPGTSIIGASTAIGLFVPSPTGTGRTIARGDNALSNQASVDLDFFNGNILDTGVGQQPPLNFWGRYVAAGANPDGLQTAILAGYYSGSKWSTATHLTVQETSGLPTTVTADWGLLGYKYP